MITPQWIVTALARTLPPAARIRYREEWLADLDGAAELDLSSAEIVRGALATTLTIDRTAPATTGVSRAALMARQARWAIAFLASAAVLIIGTWLWGGFRELPVTAGLGGLHLAGVVIQLAAVVLAALGTMFALSAVTTGTAVYGFRRIAITLGVIAVGALVVLGSMLTLRILVAVPMLLAAVAAIVVIASGGTPSAADSSRSTRRALLATLPFTALTLAAVTVGALHITLWNPLARVPGYSLDEIYAAMAAAGEGAGVVFIVIWAGFWSALAILLPIVASLRSLARVLTTRRLVVLGLLIVSGTITFQWAAGFAMGMGLADTFATSGGDASPTGPWLTITGMTALVVALIVGLRPRALRSIVTS